MTVERKIAAVFNLTNENWMRHANPWSVWTRYSVLPILIVSFWSRLWIGWWFFFPVLVALIWMFINPIVYRKPISTKNWASKAVFGERIFLNRDTIKIPKIHQTPLLKILNIISSIGFGITIWAIINYSLMGACCGTILTYLGKSWYLDRMVWLYEDMKNKNATYKSWEY